jgi:hypothetical protein
MSATTAERHWDDLWKDDEDDSWQDLVPARYQKIAKKDTFEAFHVAEGKWWE